LQEYDLDAACSLPPLAEEIGLVDRCREEHAKSVALAREIATAFSPRVAGYCLPLLHQVRSVFKMDWAEAVYIAKLRSGIKGHPSYRKVAWDMAEALKEAEPELAGLVEATSPDVEDPLTR
ncbi:MAG: FAD-dependent thymidylate synthase, partial [Acidobacteriota bacterium]